MTGSLGAISARTGLPASLCFYAHGVIGDAELAMQSHAMLLNDAPQAPRPLHDERAPPSLAGKFCTECFLFAETVPFGQSNDTAALPEGSVSGALNTCERCPIGPQTSA